MKRLWYTDLILYRSYRTATASVASTETLPQNALAILSRTADKSWKSSSFSNSGIGRISWLRDPKSTQIPASFVLSVPRSPFARCKEFPPRGISPAATSTWGRRPSSWFKAELVVGAAFGYLNMGRKRASLDRLLHEVLKFGRYLDISTNLAPWFCIPSTLVMDILVMDIRKDGITTQFCPRCRWWVPGGKSAGPGDLQRLPPGDPRPPLRGWAAGGQEWQGQGGGAATRSRATGGSCGWREETRGGFLDLFRVWNCFQKSWKMQLQPCVLGFANCTFFWNWALSLDFSRLGDSWNHETADASWTTRELEIRLLLLCAFGILPTCIRTYPTIDTSALDNPWIRVAKRLSTGKGVVLLDGKPLICAAWHERQVPLHMNVGTLETSLIRNDCNMIAMWFYYHVPFQLYQLNIYIHLLYFRTSLLAWFDPVSHIGDTSVRFYQPLAAAQAGEACYINCADGGFFD